MMVVVFALHDAVVRRSVGALCSYCLYMYNFTAIFKTQTVPLVDCKNAVCAVVFLCYKLLSRVETLNRKK